MSGTVRFCLPVALALFAAPIAAQEANEADVKRQKDERALRLTRGQLEERPTHAALFDRYFKLLVETNSIESEIETLKRRREEDEDVSSAIILGRTLLRVGDEDDALQILDEVPVKSAELQSVLGDIYFKLAKFDAAARAYQASLPAAGTSEKERIVHETLSDSGASPMPEFDVSIFWDDLLRLGVAVLLGSLIGAERQLAGQSAGLRTHVMVAIGASVLTLAGLASTGDQQVTRVVQGIAAGVGFIGAGAILREGGGDRVRGLTTAGSVWVAAALGTAAGLGGYALAAAAGCAALFVLLILKPASKWLSPRAAFASRGDPPD